jgi:carbonic anhydrase
MSDAPILSPAEAFGRLLEGNRRYLEGRPLHGSGIDAGRRRKVVAGQSAMAAILACADSRVAPELVLDAGLGDLFVCRNAGNLVDEVVLGSLEYAVEHAGCPLVCVIGHSGCGAATAAVAAGGDPAAVDSPNLAELVRRMAPAVAEVDDADVDAVARANVVGMCGLLFEHSAAITERCRSGEVAVAGLWYDLASGMVEILMFPRTMPP